MIFKLDCCINGKYKEGDTKLIQLDNNTKVDDIDTKILELIVEGKANKEISTLCEIPISTIQRRVKNILSNSLVQYGYKLNYEKLGFKSGLIHIYLKSGSVDEIAKIVYDLDRITTVEVHIGNSDIIANVIYKDSKELLDLIAEIKKIRGVGKVVWSERIYQSPQKKNVVSIIMDKSSKD